MIGQQQRWKKIEEALALNLELRPPFSRHNLSVIDFKENKVQADERACNMVIHTAVL